MRTTKTEVKRRRAEREAAKVTYERVRRVAGVSERMVYFWYRGERVSRKVADAHRLLCGNGAAVAS